MGSSGTVIRSAALLAFALCAATALAYTLHRPHTTVHRGGPAPFELVAKPGTQNVTAGGAVHYQLLVLRARYRGRIRLTATSSAPTVAADMALTSGRKDRIPLTIRGRRAQLTVRTGGQDVPGSYSLTVQAVGGRYRASLRLGLLITPRHVAPFWIVGSFRKLLPGMWRPINLLLINPHAQAISVRRLTVGLRRVNAPAASSLLPCPRADFVVRQFSGHYPLRIPAHASVRLTNLGVLPINAPQVALLNQPVNQDGCRGARVTLTFHGMASIP